MPSVRRLTAILAADVAGYSRLMGEDEEGTHERLKAHLQELVDPKIKERRGRVVKNTGDGFLAEFPSVVDAVRCGVEIQRGMVERNSALPPDKKIEFRIGINLGDVIAEEHDIFGDGVNVAARLEALAEPVLMFKVLVLQTLYTLSDEQTEYQLKDRLSFMRFVGLALHDPVPDAKAIWLYREHLARAGASERLFARFAAGKGLAGHGRPDRRCDGHRSAPTAADPGREGFDHRRRHAGRVDTGAAGPDRPRRTLDAQARAPARDAAGSRP
jgi:hypothetical protein